VRTAVDRLEPDDFGALGRAGIEPRLLFRGARGDGQRLSAELERLEPDPGTADLGAALATALSGPPRGARTVWIASHCEARAWRRLAERPAAARLPDDVRVIVADLGGGRSQPEENLALLGDPPRTQRPVVGLPVELTLRVAAAGFGAVAAAKATVVLDDEVVAQVSLDVPPDRPATALVPLVPRRPGVLRGRVALAPDAFPEDDTLHFVLNVEPRVGVLMVAPSGVEPLADPALFLRAALGSPRAADLVLRGAGDEPPAGDSPPAGGSESAGLAVTVARGDTLREEEVRGADVILVVESPLDGRRAGWIRERVSGGRAGLVLLAGSQSRGGNAAATLFGDGRGVGFAAPVGDPDSEASARGLGAIDHSHPVLAPFATAVDAAGRRGSLLDTLQVFRHAPLVPRSRPAEPGEKPAATSVLVRLDDGTPLIAESRLGKGRVFACGLPATPDWSNLPIHPAFVPLVLRTVQHLRPEPPVTCAESVRACEPAPVRLASEWRRAVVQVQGPGGRRTALELTAGDTGASGALDDTSQLGTYEFDIEPPADLQGPPLRLGMAVNPDVETAAFAHLPAAEVAGIFAPREVTVLAGTEQDPTLHATLAGRHEIWRTLIAVVLGLMALEFVVGTLEPAGPPGGPNRAGWLGRLEAALARAVGNSPVTEAP